MRLILFSCFVAVALGCGGSLSDEVGSFNSPNWPDAYTPSQNCVWTITVPTGRVQLSFSDFDLESAISGSCYDYVQVRDGSATGTVLAKVCGTTIPATLTASSNTLYVRFYSDSSVERNGFRATYQVAGSVVPDVTTPSAPAAPGGCGGSLAAATGELSSPSYPSNYPNNLDCTWTITIPEGIINLKFDDFALEASTSCTYDKLTVSDRASGASLATLCGTSASNVEGRSNAVTINFKTDSSVQAKGFKLTWSRLTCQTKGGSCVASAADCTGNVRTELFCDSGAVCCFPRFDQGDCGRIPPVAKLIGGAPRIVGGDEAEQHEWPWQASLQTTDTSFHFCGASIISNSWVVTAAHCVDGDTPSKVKVVTGEHHQKTDSGVEQEHAVQSIHMHEAYDGNGNGFPNDIALLKLRDPIVFDRHRLPICLAELEDDFVGSHCFITGWGLTKGTGDDDVLNELFIDVLTQAVCTSKWGASYINPGHICLGNGLAGACNGDSGGPLACQKTQDGVTRWLLAGATSWGRSGCQTEGYPSVYSRISYFRTWIETTIRNNA